MCVRLLPIISGDARLSGRASPILLGIEFEGEELK